MNGELPAYAKAWAMQWKHAGPALQAIRDQDLRQLDGTSSVQLGSGGIAGHLVFERHPEKHGMVVMQRWLQRRALIVARGQTPDA
jgi:hypothetical protein